MSFNNNTIKNFTNRNFQEPHLAWAFPEEEKTPSQEQQNIQPSLPVRAAPSFTFQPPPISRRVTSAARQSLCNTMTSNESPPRVPFSSIDTNASSLMLPPPSPATPRKHPREPLAANSPEHIRRRSLGFQNEGKITNPVWVEIIEANDFFKPAKTQQRGIFHPPATPKRAIPPTPRKASGFQSRMPAGREVNFQGTTIFLPEHKKAFSRENKGGEPASDIFVIKVKGQSTEKIFFTKYPKDRNTFSELENQYHVLTETSKKNGLPLAYPTEFDRKNFAIIQEKTEKLPRDFLEALAKQGGDLVKLFLQKTILNPLALQGSAYENLDIKYDNLGGLEELDLQALNMLRTSNDPQEISWAKEQVLSFLQERLAIFDYHFQRKDHLALWAGNLKYLLEELFTQSQDYKDWLIQELQKISSPLSEGIALGLMNKQTSSSSSTSSAPAWLDLSAFD